MFSKTLQTVLPYAQELEAHGIRLALPGQSPLSVLMSYSAVDNPQVIEASDAFIQRVNNVTILDGGLSEHEGSMLTLVDELVPLVESHIRVARQVGQLASELSENVRRYVNSVPAVDASGEFNIVKDELSDLFSEPSVLGLIERAGTAPVRSVTSNHCSAARDFETLLSYLMTGGKLDQSVKELVASYDSSWLENIWYGLFAPATGLSSRYSLDTLSLLPAGERLAVGYVSHAIASKLLGTPPPDAIGNLSQFENQIADLRDQMLVVMSGAVGEFQHQISQKVVAVGYRKQERTVLVNGPVYREWLEVGGAPELVLGSLLSGNPAHTADEFAERGNEFQRQWNGFCVIHNAESDLRRSNFFRGIYLTCFTEALGKIAPFEEAFRKARPTFAEQAVSSAESFLTQIGIDALSNVENTALHLTAGIRFDYTPAKGILKDIDDVTKSTPGVNVREAALVAACNYLALYLANQMAIDHK